MIHSDECAVVIPCLNEEAAIGEVVAGARRYFTTVVVVDDGSTDGSAQRAEAAGSLVLRHGRNRGKGAALRTGLTWLRGRGFAWGLTMDGDGQHSPEDLPKFLRAAGQSHAALLVGNRLTGAGRMPWVRRRVNCWMSRRLSALIGLEIPDSQCGFRMLRMDAWDALHFHTSHFEIESEMLAAFHANGHGIEFVPIRVIYAKERSKIRPLTDSIRWFRWWTSAVAQRRTHPAPLAVNSMIPAQDALLPLCNPPAPSPAFQP